MKKHAIFRSAAASSLLLFPDAGGSFEERQPSTRDKVWLGGLLGQRKRLGGV